MAISAKRAIGRLLLWIVISAFGGGILLVGLALLILHLMFSTNSCDVTIIQNSTSPDGTMELAVEFADCGSMSSDVHRIYLVPIGKPCKPENLAFDCAGVRDYSAHWLAPGHIRIEFCSKKDPGIKNRTATGGTDFWSWVKNTPYPARWLHPQTGQNMTVEVVRSCPKQ